MNILAALKWADLRPAVHPLTGEVTHDARGWGLSAGDAAALEWALRMGAAWGADVWVATVGPPDAVAAVRLGLEAGAARAVRIDAPAGLTSDAVASALALVAARADVICCGDRSAAGGSGSVPSFLAAELGVAAACGLSALELGGPGELVVERRLDRGRRDRLGVRAPAVISVEGVTAGLRRAALSSVVAAHGRNVEVLPFPPGAVLERGPVAVRRRRPYRPRAKELAAPQGSARDRARELSGVAQVREVPRAVEVGPAEAAELILSQLRAWGYLDGPP